MSGRLAEHLRRHLVAEARSSILHGLTHGEPPAPRLDEVDPILARPRAAFVTLTRQSRLRGCIGSLEAHRPLIADIVVNAYAAAFRDPRFTPLSPAETADLHIHLSILSEPEPMVFASEAEFFTQLRAGEDGLILSDGQRRATFLPAVWESIPGPGDFVRELKRKAGVAADASVTSLQIWRYSTERFGE